MDLMMSEEIDEPAWRDFVQRQEHANIFHTPEMFRVFDVTPGHRPTVWIAYDDTGSPVALFTPVEITLFRGPLRYVTSRSVAYGGVLRVRGALGDQAAVALVDAHRRRGRGHAMFTELRHIKDASDLGPALRSIGYRHEDHLNYLIALDQSEESMWGRLSRTAKQRVRSAVKKGVIVGEVTTEGETDEAFELLERVYAAAQVPLADRELFHAAKSILGPLGTYRVVTARIDGRMIGARFLLLHGSRIIDWYAASDRQFASFSPGDVLVWETLRWGREHGYEIFDFGGAGRPDEPYGPREFKAKFGGELVNFGRDVLVHGPLRMRVGRMGYEATRRIMWSRSSKRVKLAAISPRA